jgi:hypothetical protein
MNNEMIKLIANKLTPCIYGLIEETNERGERGLTNDDYDYDVIEDLLIKKIKEILKEYEKE